MTKTTEHTIDVRTIPPRQKHPTIFNAWNELADGESLLILNDHDPLPLYYQFACEFAGQFQWAYEAQGPELWRVRISKGDFPDPGFVPRKKAAAVPNARIASAAARGMVRRSSAAPSTRRIPRPPPPCAALSITG